MSARMLPAAGVLVVLALWPAAAFPQSAGGRIAIGPRISFTSPDAPEGAQRFSGGVIRFGGGMSVLEIGMDYRSGLTGDLTERIKDYPLQVSTIIYPIRARFAPYLVGGMGWYSQRVQQFDGAGPNAVVVDDTTTRTMGYHAGFGAEVRVHRRIGLSGDYRYTFLDANSPVSSSGDSSSPAGRSIADRLKLSHRGARLAWGANFYF